jgi:hypothetical protein
MCEHNIQLLCLSHATFLIAWNLILKVNNLISLRKLYLTGDGVGARTCLTGDGECLIGDGDCCLASCALAAIDGGVGDLDFGLGGILGGVLCGSCCPVAPSMTISTVAIDLASKWASIFWKIWKKGHTEEEEWGERATRSSETQQYRKIPFQFGFVLFLKSEQSKQLSLSF